jgi:hypothetical protein
MRVVNRYKEPYTHNIQRGTRLGNRYSHVPTNHYGVMFVATRQEAIAGFEADARNSPLTRAAIMRLPEDAVLGCTCKPKDCHGDVIVKLWHEWHGLPYKEEPQRKRLL